MPHRPLDKGILDPPAWLKRIDDTCLAEMLTEALIARAGAVKAGALQHQRSRGVVESGDHTLEQIVYERYHGPVACRKAADVLRKYQQALDGMFAARPKSKQHRSRD